MTKAEYLVELERQIQRLPQKDRMEIMADYQEHFEMAMAAGKNEADICVALGTPRSVGQAIMMNSLVQEAKSSTNVSSRAHALLKIMLLCLVLAPFNFLILIGPFLILFSLLFAGWVTPLTLGAVATYAGIELIKVGVTGLGVFSGLSIASMWLGTIGIMFLVCMLMWLFTRGSLWLLIAFFKWNIDFITSRKT